MLASDADYLARLLKRRTGIAINPSKTGQIASRLSPVARRFGFKNTDELMRDLPNARESLVRTVIEAMTTNDTWFFRDRAPFEQFREIVLPDLMSRRVRSKKLRIWSAATSAGQEAYTLAMILSEAGLEDWTIELVASDINGECIARAKEGLYTSFEIQRGLGVKRLVTNFTQEGENWRVSENLRRMVKFRTFNLLDDYGVFGEMDVIFCRNVLLYFEPQTKARILDRLSDTLAPDGYLIVGTAEMPHQVTNAFEHVPDTRGLYIKPEESYSYAVL